MSVVDQILLSGSDISENDVLRPHPLYLSQFLKQEYNYDTQIDTTNSCQVSFCEQNTPVHLNLCDQTSAELCHKPFEPMSAQSLFLYLQNLDFIFYNRTHFDMILQHFPSIQLFTVRPFRLLQAYVGVFKYGWSIRTLIYNLTCAYETDVCVRVICSIQNMSLQQKVKELVIYLLFRLRTFLTTKMIHTSFVYQQLNPTFLEYYTFKHSDLNIHTELSHVCDVINGNTYPYLCYTLDNVKYRNKGCPVNIHDTLLLLLEHEQNHELFWDVLMPNIDLVIALRHTGSGVMIVSRVIQKLLPSIRERNIRFQYLFQVAKRFINYAYDYLPKYMYCTKLYASYEGTMSYCICCFEDFKHHSSFVIECTVCKCAMCTTCVSRLNVQSKSMQCPQCKEVGVNQASALKMFNFPTFLNKHIRIILNY